MITINNKDVVDIILDNKNVTKIQDANTLDIMWIKRSPSNEYFYIENDYNGNNTISITTSVGTGTITGNHASKLEYSKDKENWTTITLRNTTQTISMNSGDKVYFRNDNGYFNWYNNSKDRFFTKITCSEIHSVGGNINTLLDYTDDNVSCSPYCFYNLFYGNNKLTNAENLYMSSILDIYCYSSMFEGCTSLTSAPALPATTLAQSCYSYMFSTCSSLTTPPALPATTLANYCYSSMFYNCTSLASAPTLTATTLTTNCYSSMFWGCSSLTSAPALPATTLAMSCYYNMFCGCSSLTTPPSLPATTLAGSCYHKMFKDCTALTVAPSLPVTTLASNCYALMLSGCTSLTTAPTLPATTLVDGCYYEMLLGCTSLNDVTTYANDISAFQCTYQWLSNVSSSGTFHNLGSATYSRDSSGVPSGWTIVNS